MKYHSKVLSTFQWTMEISLQDDLKGLFFDYLCKAGYKDVEKKDAVYQYYNLQKRKIEEKPRNIRYAKEFRCPPEYVLALQEFEEKVKNGNDLSVFQSDNIHQCNYNDLLLNDWGIQHFHLSRRFRADGTVKRSDYEIFAYVTDDTIYMIQIYMHREKDLYSKREMIRILRDNWPELIDRFHIPDFVEMTEKLNDHQYDLIRKAGALTMLELGKNEVYYPIGGGYTSNGFSVTALQQADLIMNKAAKWQLVIVENAEKIGKTFNQIKGTDKKFCNMKIQLLWLDDDTVTLSEAYSGLFMQINTREFWIRICWFYELFEELKL